MPRHNVINLYMHIKLFKQLYLALLIFYFIFGYVEMSPAPLAPVLYSTAKIEPKKADVVGGDWRSHRVWENGGLDFKNYVDAWSNLTHSTFYFSR